MGKTDAFTGYLALVDITRASTIVSSRTMDSLISLFVITVLYFIMVYQNFNLFSHLSVLDNIEIMSLRMILN